MEFKFKRKYTNFIIIALILHSLVLSFWIFAPLEPFDGVPGKNTISLLGIINVELILIFYLGLYRKKYFAYYDKIIVRRSFLKTLTIKYSSITTIKEKNNDSILFGFGTRPSFTIYYKSETRRNKKQTIRPDNATLLLKVIKNEMEISKK